MNTLTIDKMTEPEMDDVIGRRVFDQAIQIWIGPELDRRKEAGRLPPNFKLWAAQIILNPDSAAPEVRINHEVKAVYSAQLGDKILDKGDETTVGELGDLTGIHLTDEDPNCGHITMIVWKAEGWRIGFDFRYNAARVTGHAEAAREFLDAARSSRDRGQMRAFIDNLHSAVELMAKGRLLLLPGREALEATSHGFVHSRSNLYAHKGVIEAHYAQLLNHIAPLRVPARYLSRDLNITIDEAAKLVELAEELYIDLVNQTPTRVSAN